MAKSVFNSLLTLDSWLSSRTHTYTALFSFFNALKRKSQVRQTESTEI